MGHSHNSDRGRLKLRGFGGGQVDLIARSDTEQSCSEDAGGKWTGPFWNSICRP